MPMLVAHTCLCWAAHMCPCGAAHTRSRWAAHTYPSWVVRTCPCWVAHTCPYWLHTRAHTGCTLIHVGLHTSAPYWVACVFSLGRKTFLKIMSCLSRKTNRSTRTWAPSSKAPLQSQRNLLEGSQTASPTTNIPQHSPQTRTETGHSHPQLLQ